MTFLRNFKTNHWNNLIGPTSNVNFLEILGEFHQIEILLLSSQLSSTSLTRQSTTVYIEQFEHPKLHNPQIASAAWTFCMKIDPIF